jgi:hypothetical protein
LTAETSTTTKIEWCLTVTLAGTAATKKRKKMSENVDNLEAAMNHEAEHLDPTIQPNTGSTPGSPAVAQVLIRTTPEERERWKQAAESKGLTVSDFIRQAVGDAASNILDCQHPLNQRRWYPWAEFCLACGQRLRG